MKILLRWLSRKRVRRMCQAPTMEPFKDSRYQRYHSRHLLSWLSPRILVWAVGIFMGTSNLYFCDGDQSTSSEHLRSANAKERNIAVNSIETNNDKQHFKDLERMAKEDPDPSIRHNAIGVMSRLGDTDAKQLIADIASHSSDEGDREVAVSALPMLLSKEEAFPVLKQALQDQSNIVRIRAAGNLGRYGDYSGEKILLDGSQSKDQRTWGETMRAIGQVNTPAIRKRLEELAAGTYPGHYEAKEALRRLQYAEASPVQQLTMAKADISSIYSGIVHLGCEKLADLGTQESIQLLFTLANNPKQYDSFRAARDVLVFKKVIDRNHYWDQPLKPK